MQAYGVREAAKLLRLAPSTIRSLIAAGFVAPSRGPRNAWRLSFQDLILLRTAQALASANVPARRITRSMRELRRRLPASMPLCGLQICAEADRVVVRQGRRRWHADSGQYLLAFEGDPADGSLSVLERPKRTARALPADWFERALALEAHDTVAAMAAYERALAADPTLIEAYLNLGRLLHDLGHFDDAERLYREAVKACGEQPALLYNLGVLLADSGRKTEAAQAYHSALRLDPAHADCCYNLALLCEALGKPRDAIRYMAQYRRLMKNRK